MNAYYSIIQVNTHRGTTYYDLDIPFQDYYIIIYTTTNHLPHKRLTKYRPLSYFMIFPGDVLGIVICPKEKDGVEPNHRVEIEKPDRKTLKLLIEKVGKGISGVKLGRNIKPEDIVNEFLKTLLIEQ